MNEEGVGHEIQCRLYHICN